MKDEVILTTGKIKKYREDQLKEQLGYCDLCNDIIIRPNLDHSHLEDGGDGYCRGTICNSCNTLLGAVENNWRSSVLYEDLPAWLISASKYIQKYRDCPSGILHPAERSKLNKKRAATRKKAEIAERKRLREENKSTDKDSR